MKELLEETEKNSSYIHKQGFNLVECWECEWRDMKRTNKDLQRFIATRPRRPLDKVKTMTLQTILGAVKHYLVASSVTFTFRNIYANIFLRCVLYITFLQTYVAQFSHVFVTTNTSLWPPCLRRYKNWQNNVCQEIVRQRSSDD